MRAWLCIFLPHKLEHITDIISWIKIFEQPNWVGLWQCKRCKKIVKDKLSSTTPEKDDYYTNGWGKLF